VVWLLWDSGRGVDCPEAKSKSTLWSDASGGTMDPKWGRRKKFVELTVGRHEFLFWYPMLGNG
jgi:hypothetical protein